MICSFCLGFPINIGCHCKATLSPALNSRGTTLTPLLRKHTRARKEIKNSGINYILWVLRFFYFFVLNMFVFAWASDAWLCPWNGSLQPCHLDEQLTSIHGEHDFREWIWMNIETLLIVNVHQNNQMIRENDFLAMWLTKGIYIQERHIVWMVECKNQYILLTFIKNW